MLVVPLKQTRAIGGMDDSKSGAGNEFKMGLEHHTRKLPETTESMSKQLRRQLKPESDLGNVEG